MFNMGELPEKTVDWEEGGSPRGQYRRMLAGVGTGWRWYLEVRCPIDGYLRWHSEVRPRSVPYWAWRGVVLAVKVRVYARIAVLPKCPQCKFDRRVRGWAWR